MRSVVPGFSVSAAGLLALSVAGHISAQELERPPTMVDEIVVTSALHRSRAETVLPVNVLAGDEVREKAAATLGEMLEGQVGVNNASFGVGVGLPVIRGQSANRVQVLQMGVGNLDASAVSADHANSLEPALADRIEVVRGPATLLYGNGAIGGVVNVIDGRIPRTFADGLDVLAETRYDTVNDERTAALRLDGGSGRFAWHLDALDRDSNDAEIAGFALNPDLVDLDDPEAVEELLESRGRLANSNAASDSQTIGGSWILDNNGWIGIAYNQMDNEYGLPRGAHAHHEHEEGEEEAEHDEAHEEDEGDVRIVMEQKRWDSEARIPLNNDWFEEFHGKFSVVDYQHAEVESTGETGTLFENDGYEGRLTLHLNQPMNQEGVIGMQFGNRDFSATGEEAFIPPTDIGSLALFGLQSFSTGAMTYEFGLRAERQQLSQSSGCDVDSTNWSGSGSAIWQLNDTNNLLFSINRSERSATVEELFSNIDASCNELPQERLVAHAATQRLEIGLPDADKEVSTNLEFGWRKFAGDVTAELNVFRNQIDDYLFLFDSGEFVDDVEIARYQQRDATFTGFEAQASVPLYANGDHQSDLTVFGDYVRARFDQDGNVPRIPPLRLGLEWVHSHVDWTVKLRWAHVADQNRHASNETATDGYQLLSLYGDYRMEFNDSSSLLLFVRGNNLLDENIRQHTSLLKDVAPAPGRGYELGLRLEF
ncbi:MAG: TonB-dependent receptor [Gammaproteobacteria bacterium]|nr:TonB-dependent receptor [Pseudomonadales bacterium]MCP5347082.1 TonB-dependent receptor [Pseudomonadales bacterium]